MTKEQMGLWNKVKTPDPKHTKSFNRGGGFKGTATNTQYTIQQATEVFGMNGVGWGHEILEEKFQEGAPVIIKDNFVCNEVIHIIRGRVWYVVNGDKYTTSPHFGQTTFVGSNKYGVFTDEEAPKKSVTDMMIKCLSLLGFSADIFLGLWDDQKYVAEVRNSFKEKPDKTDADIIDEWEKEADKNADTVETLKAWYTKKAADVGQLKPAVKKTVNSYVTQLKQALIDNQPETIKCPNGGDVTEADCKESKCSSTFEKCKKSK